MVSARVCWQKSGRLTLRWPCEFRSELRENLMLMRDLTEALRPDVAGAKRASVFDSWVSLSLQNALSDPTMRDLLHS